MNENWILLVCYCGFIPFPSLSLFPEASTSLRVAGRRRRSPPRRNFFEPVRQLLAKGRPLTSLPPPPPPSPPPSPWLPYPPPPLSRPRPPLPPPPGKRVEEEEKIGEGEKNEKTEE